MRKETFNLSSAPGVGYFSAVTTGAVPRLIERAGNANPVRGAQMRDALGDPSGRCDVVSAALHQTVGDHAGEAPFVTVARLDSDGPVVSETAISSTGRDTA